jgi:hypothetical protein
MPVANFANIVSYPPPWTRDSLWIKARSIPSLDLNFAVNKNLIDSISRKQLITFTRASTGTYVDPNGTILTAAINVPRFHHDPVTGQCLGLLVEEQRANLRTDSNAILVANSYGVNNATLTSVSISTPLGGTTASLFALNVGANTGNNTDGWNFGSGTIANSTAHTQSVFVRMSGATVFRLRSNVTGEVFSITPSSGAPAPSGTITACTVQPFRDGWFRISWTFTSTTTVPGNRGDHWTIKSDVADGVGGYHIAGAQLEAGAFPTSYIPTTGTSATRSADIARITGTAFSGWYNQGQGTLYGDAFRQFAVPGGDFPIIADMRTAADRLQIGYLTEAAAGGLVYVGGAAQAEMYPGSGNARNRKVALAAAVNSYGATCNGGSALTDASGSMPTSMTSLSIGSTGSSQFLNGTISRLTYWPTRLPNATLQALTT